MWGVLAATDNGRASCLQMTVSEVSKKGYACYLCGRGTSNLIRSRSRWQFKLTVGDKSEEL